MVSARFVVDGSYKLSWDVVGGIEVAETVCALRVGSHGMMLCYSFHYDLYYPIHSSAEEGKV